MRSASRERATRRLAELGQHSRPYKLATGRPVEVGALAVEFTTVFSHHSHADQVAVDEIGEFGVYKKSHCFAPERSASLLAALKLANIARLVVEKPTASPFDRPDAWGTDEAKRVCSEPSLQHSCLWAAWEVRSFSPHPC